MEKTCTCGSCKEPCAKNISIFSTLSTEELLKIVNMTEHKSFEENDVLCREGEKSDKLFLIREGRVKICKITKEGKEQIANYCGITRETVSRRLSKFDKLGIIKLQGNKGLIVKDKEALFSLAE
ncbi:helix-turn-helix domain-containing protein [Clostridium perfringens]